MLSLWIHQRKQLAKWMCSMFHSIHYFNLFFGLFRQMVLGWKNNDGAFPVSQGELWKREESSHMSGSRVHFKCLTQEDGTNVHCLVFFGGGLLVSKVQSRSRGSCSASGSGSPAAHWTSTPENTSVLRLTPLAHFKYATEFYHFVTMSQCLYHHDMLALDPQLRVSWLDGWEEWWVTGFFVVVDVIVVDRDWSSDGSCNKCLAHTRGASGCDAAVARFSLRVTGPLV